MGENLSFTIFISQITFLAFFGLLIAFTYRDFKFKTPTYFTIFLIVAALKITSNAILTSVGYIQGGFTVKSTIILTLLVILRKLTSSSETGGPIQKSESKTMNKTPALLLVFITCTLICSGCERGSKKPVPKTVPTTERPSKTDGSYPPCDSKINPDHPCIDKGVQHDRI